MILNHIDYLSPTGQVVQDAFIRIEGKRIAAIQPQPFPQESCSEPSLNGKGLLLLPAFCNAHCHIPMTLLRGIGEELPLHRWLTEAVFPFEALLAEQDVYWGTLLGIAELLASGCVSFSDMYMHVSGIIKAIDETGIKANLCNAAIGQEPFRLQNAWRDTQIIQQAVANRQDDRIQCDIGLHAEYTTPPSLWKEVANYARESNLRIQAHLSETEREQIQCKERNQGKTPLQCFAEAGLLEQPCLFAHCVHLDDCDDQLVHEAISHGAQITFVHNPSSNLKLGSGIAPLKRWYKAGVNVALGTDGASSNNNLNFVEELNLASLLQKGLYQDPTFMSPLETLHMASRAGFLAQGRTDSGLIEVGARADLVAFHLDHPLLAPQDDPLPTVCYAAQSADVAFTMADGRLLYREGEWLTLDIRQIQAEVNRIRREKMGQLC